MKIEVVERGEKSIRVRIIGEDHTFCNILRKMMYEDDNVEMAPYTIEHPMLGHPEFYVKVRRGKPEDAMLKAAKRLMERCEELREKLKNKLETR